MPKKEVIPLCIVFFLVTILSASAQICGDGSCDSNETIDNCFTDCKRQLIRATSLFGQVVDDSGRPITNELVTAHWIDEFGENQTSITRTLTRRAAEQIGNQKLEGFFLFTEGSIKAKPNTEIEVRTQPRYTFLKVQAQPGRTADVGELMVFGNTPNPEREKADRKNRTNIIATVFGWLYNTIKNNIKKLILFAVLATVLVLFYREYRHRKRIKSITDFALYSAIKNVVPTTLEDIMTKRVITAVETTSAGEIAKKMVHHKVNSVVITRHKKPVGIVTEIDFIKKVYENENTDVTAKEIMHAPIWKMQPKGKILDALHLMLHHKIRKLPVVKNQHLVGIITLTDVGKAINRLLTNKKLKDEQIPHVNSIYDKTVIKKEKDTPLIDVIKIMKEKEVDYCIVYDYTDASKTATRNVGIITSRDLIEEFFKNRHAPSTLKASHVMKTPIVSINPRLNAIEANRIMMDKKFRRLPILVYNKIVGMLTEDMLLESIHHFLVQTKKKIDEYKKIIK